MASTSSSQNLLRPSAARPTPSSPQKPSSASSAPKPPLSTDPTTTISEIAHFQGTHPITIGAGTVIHPRTKFLSFEGPIDIGEGCIIGEKAVIGGGSSGGSGQDPAENPASTPTVIGNSVVIGPLATVSAGAYIYSAATIDTSASIGGHVQIGKHAKVCTSCCLPENDVVDDWTVIWGSGVGNNYGMGLQRRKRPRGRGSEATGGLGGRDVERARLTVIDRERDGLMKLIGVGTGAKRR